MRLKVLLLALVVAISAVAVIPTVAKAEGPSVTPYADVLFWTGVTMTDKYSSGKVDDKGKAVGDTDLIMGVTPQGSIGVRGMVNNVNGNFAIMSKTPGFDTAQEPQTYLFIAVIMYNFGPANLTVGRFFTNYDMIAGDNTNCPDTKLGWDMFLGYSLFDATRDQISLSFPVGFYVTLAKNAKNEDRDYDVMLPLVAAGYMNGNPGTPMMFSVHGLYQTYKYDNSAMVDDDNDPLTPPVLEAGSTESVSSYAVAGKFGMNMAPFSFAVQGYYGVNIADMGILTGGAASFDATGSVQDNVAMGGWAQADYTMGQMRIAGGVAYKQNKQDVSGAKADKAMAYFVALKYNIQPNFAITPSVMIQDNMKAADGKTKQGKKTSAGVLFEAHI